MDPLAAIGLAAAIIQFVDFSSRLIGSSREIRGSLSGATEGDQSLEIVTKEMQHLTAKLAVPYSPHQTEEEMALGRLSAECHILSDQLLSLLEKTRSKNAKSKLRSTLAALRSMLHEREKLELQRRLENCRCQLELQLGYLSRFNELIAILII